MNEARTVFAQLMAELPKYEFEKCVRRYGGNHRVRALPTYEQFLVMPIDSPRDISTRLSYSGPNPPGHRAGR